MSFQDFHSFFRWRYNKTLVCNFYQWKIVVVVSEYLVDAGMGVGFFKRYYFFIADIVK